MACQVRSKLKNGLIFPKQSKLIKKDKLSTMSGFVSLDMAVKADADKKRVLEQMEKQDLDWLPVVKQENGVSHFQGIVERSRLTASLILDVTNQLENKKKEQTN